MATTLFTIKQGDSFAINITIKDSEGVAMDLTGKTVFFTAKKWKEDTDANAIISKAVLDIITPEDGTVTISLTAEETALFREGVYWWDIQVVDGDSVQSTAKARLRVTSDVTNEITS